jgi:hypothetical protein
MSEVSNVKIAAIAKAGTTSNVVDLEDYYPYLHVVIPTIDTATLKVQVSELIDGTYQDLGASVTAASSTGAYSDTWTLGGWRYIKIVAGAAQNTGEVKIKVRGWRG